MRLDDLLAQVGAQVGNFAGKLRLYNIMVNAFPGTYKFVFAGAVISYLIKKGKEI